MATGQVKQMYAENPIPVIVVGLDNKPQWSEVFEFNPKIVRKRTTNKFQTLLNGGGCRPYIRERTSTQWTWKPFGPIPGEFFFQEVELHWGQRYTGKILVEPNVKAKVGHTNKAWPFERWQELVDRDVNKYIQCGPANTRWLKGVHRCVTPSFRYVATVVKHVKAFVGAEGGLMHAAAALDTPAVILWSEFIDPTITGYQNHINIRKATKTCGMRIPCAGCAASMEAITVDEVDEAIRGIK